MVVAAHVVTSALVMTSGGVYKVNKCNNESTMFVWKYISFMANIPSFLITGYNTSLTGLSDIFSVTGYRSICVLSYSIQVF